MNICPRARILNFADIFPEELHYSYPLAGCKTAGLGVRLFCLVSAVVAALCIQASQIYRQDVEQ